MSTAAAPSSRPGALAVPGKETLSRLFAPASGVAALAAVLGPLALYVAHAALFGGWLIDDAGISFAYARNLAEGHGLVSQPGSPAVEGFSNPAWTLLLGALQAVGLFDVVWTPKMLSVALVALLFVVIASDAREGREPALVPALAATLLAQSTSFVVWTSSGLENPLLAFLLGASCALTRRSVETGGRGIAASAGAVAGLAALTRPDAILFAAAFPASLVSTAAGWTRDDQGSRVKQLVSFATGLALSLGPYLAFRRLYFGDWLPNTYYAKEKPSLVSLLDLAKLGDLLESLFGALAVVVAGLLVLELWRFVRTARARPRHAVLLIHLGLALASYVLLPADWMGEYRFATGALLFLCWWAAELAAEGMRRAGPTLRLVFAAGLVVLVAEGAVRHASRSAAFAQNPVTPFSRVAAFAGRGYDALGAALGPGPASLLTPDVGGAFYYSHLRVYDLVGLCDREAARTLTHDRAAFHRHVFERVRPTFIHVHGAWAGWAALHTSPLFARDYVALFEAWNDAFAAGASGSEPSRGDYVRRDALSDPATLDRLRRVYVEVGLARVTF